LHNFTLFLGSHKRSPVSSA